MFRETEKPDSACLMSDEWVGYELGTNITAADPAFNNFVGALISCHHKGCDQWCKWASSMKTGGWGPGRFLSFRRGLVLSCSGDYISICSFMGPQYLTYNFITHTYVRTYVRVLSCSGDYICVDRITWFLYMRRFFIVHISYCLNHKSSS